MRDILQAMAEAGVRRARFQGQFSGVSSRGYSKLCNVLPPVGYIEHCWVSQILEIEPGSTVSFLASIRAYVHVSGEPDFTLDDVEVLA